MITITSENKANSRKKSKQPGLWWIHSESYVSGTIVLIIWNLTPSLILALHQPLDCSEQTSSEGFSVCSQRRQRVSVKNSNACRQVHINFRLFILTRLLIWRFAATIGLSRHRRKLEAWTKPKRGVLGGELISWWKVFLNLSRAQLWAWNAEAK